jgi:hypothetical protein
VYVSGTRPCVISMRASTGYAQFQDCLSYRFQGMMHMGGILHGAKLHRHCPGQRLRDSTKGGASMKIYVGNLPPEVTEQELREEFATFGEVASVNIIKDKYTGHPRGFGFVEMTTVSQGQAAIAGLNGKALRDQALTVNAARPPSGNRGGGSYGNRRGGWSGRGRQSRY